MLRTMRFRFACMSFLTLLLAVRLSANDQAAESSAKIVAVEDAVYGRVHGAGLLCDMAFAESKQPLRQ